MIIRIEATMKANKIVNQKNWKQFCRILEQNETLVLDKGRMGFGTLKLDGLNRREVMAIRVKSFKVS